VRPGGWRARLGLERRSVYHGVADLRLLLTEFADPGGEATYFLVSDASTGLTMNWPILARRTDRDV